MVKQEVKASSRKIIYIFFFLLFSLVYSLSSLEACVFLFWPRLSPVIGQ